MCCVGAVGGKLTSRAHTLTDLIKTAAWRQVLVEKKSGVSILLSLCLFFSFIIIFFFFFTHIRPGE